MKNYLAPSSWRIICFYLMAMLSTDQAAIAQSGDCDCEVTFNQLIEKLEANYIGLKHFRAKGKGAEYEARKADFASRAPGVKGPDCAAFLQNFLDYFEDGHLYVIERPQYEGSKLDSIHAKIDAERKTVEELQATLAVQKNEGGDRVIGTYKDHVSEFTLIRENDAYALYITRSTNEQVMPGEVKAIFKSVGDRFRGTYYTYGHMPRFMKAGLYKENTLLRIESSILIKTDTEFKRELGMADFEDTSWPTVQKLDEDNVLLSIPKFSVSRDDWNRITKDHKELLRNAKNLIIDIRGNRGGNAIYFSIFNLFADSEMPGGQGHVLASADNLAYFKRNLKFSKKIYQPVVDAIEAKMGEIVDGPLYPKRNYRRLKSSKVENVAILTDGACMSAAESFIIHSRQNSSLVKTFGSPTDGVIDYTSVNAVRLESGRQNILFGYPTSTLSTEPEGRYNQTGMLPDVPIADSVKDKVAFIMAYYKDR